MSAATVGSSQAFLHAAQRVSQSNRHDGGSERRSGVGSRAFDVVAASVLSIAVSPVIVACALAIWLEDRGPIVYRQTRVGQDGAPFRMLKFRSMRVDAEADGTPRWADANDARVTRVGRFIRRMRIDELPQLLNVLRGEMSLIGPRPERPAFVDTLSRELPNYAIRHRVRPGITGLAQVRYRYAASIDDAARKLEYDIEYVANRSAWLDLRILVATVGVVLLGIGAR